MKSDTEIVNETYQDIIKGDSFNGDYIGAMISSLAILKGFRFIEKSIKNERKKEHEKFTGIKD